MTHFRRLAPALAGAAFALTACASVFRVKDYDGQNERLFQASLGEYGKHHWDNAISGFEKLTLELPARDTLLPRAHFMLAKAHYRKQEFVLAAQAFSRVAESFPTDSLGDDALLWTARAYQRLWHKPTLDAQYGQSALATYQLLATLYPDSPLRANADRQIAQLQEWLATKEFENGMHYFRRKAYDSAIIYFKTVVQNYASTPTARDAGLKLLASYRAIRYTQDATELCETLKAGYPQDSAVRAACGRTMASSVTPPPAAAAPLDAARGDTTAVRSDSTAARPPTSPPATPPAR